MIISRTPFRISFFGGGTDYPRWYLKHGGAVIGTAINKYCYISVRTLPPFFDHRHRIAYSRVELVKTVEEIQHPTVRAALSEYAPVKGLEIHHDGDLPARSGLGSSSSFAVGLLNALHAQTGRMVTARELAQEAIHLEQDVMHENVGSQDQIWAAFGGTNLTKFNADGSFEVQPLVISPSWQAELEAHMMLLFTGLTRMATEIAAELVVSLEDRAAELTEMRQMVDEGLKILTCGRPAAAEFGRLMHESWKRKRALASNISTAVIDEIYERARAAGAYGGKLLGAGGGGFLLLVAPPEAQQHIRERLHGFIEVHFKMGASGSRIVIYEPNGLESR